MLLVGTHVCGQVGSRDIATGTLLVQDVDEASSIEIALRDDGSLEQTTFE